MKFTQLGSEKAILNEFGNRIKQYRISMNVTQQQLAQRCGVSVSTMMRIENGDDPKWSTIIKILSEFNLLDNLDVLIPEPHPDYKAMFEEKTARKRARPDKKKSGDTWVWEEDKENED